MARAVRIGRWALALSLLALTAAILIPVTTGRTFVSYASSGSMEPTIGVLDGFLVNPWPGELGPGDIVVFHSVLQDGPAVHRIVAAEGDGWLTQGDANPGLDQTMGEPLLTRDRILGKVITRNGEPIVLEQLGSTFLEARIRVTLAAEAAGGPRQLAVFAFLLVGLLSAIPAFSGKRKRALPPRLSLRQRVALRRLFPRGILGRHVAFALLVLVLASLLVAYSQARFEVATNIIVLQDASAGDGTRAAGPGVELPRDIDVAALGFLPTIAIVDPEEGGRVRVGNAGTFLGPGEEAKVEVWQRAGDVVGLQQDAVPVWRYPAILPTGAMVALHEAAPGSPYALLGALILGAGYVWMRLLRISTLPVARTLGIQEEWL